MRQDFALLRFAAWALIVCVPAATAQTAPLRIFVVEGEGAINNIGSKTARAPVVRIEDDDSRPLAGVNVTFTVPDMGAGGFFATGGSTFVATSDERGIAAARGLRPNNVAGRFQIRVRATRNGQTASAVINQINAAPAGAKGGFNKKLLLLGLAAGGAVGAVFALRGGSSSGAPQLPPANGGGTIIVPGSPVFGPPR